MKKKNKKLLIWSFIIGGFLLVIHLVRDNKKNGLDEEIDAGESGSAQNESDYKNLSNDPQKVFKTLESEFKHNPDDLEILNTAERILRLESNHFKSNIYKHTLGGAFVAVRDSYPFGFSAPKTVWEKYGKPKGVYKSTNGLSYIVFPSLENGVRSVMALLKGYYSNGYTTGHYFEGDANYVQKLNNLNEDRLFTESYNGNKYLIS